MTKLVVIVAFLAACGGGDKAKDDKGGGDKKSDDKVASCNQPKIGGCREYRGGNLALGTDSLKKLCSAMSPGDFTEKPCPTEKVTGTCTKPEGKDYYYADNNPVPLENLEKYCKEGGGTWAK